VGGTGAATLLVLVRRGSGCVLVVALVLVHALVLLREFESLKLRLKLRRELLEWHQRGHCVMPRHRGAPEDSAYQCGCLVLILTSRERPLKQMLLTAEVHRKELAMRMRLARHRRGRATWTYLALGRLEWWLGYRSPCCEDADDDDALHASSLVLLR